jgi:ABC-type amino acid transport substrate-binding protein
MSHAIRFFCLTLLSLCCAAAHADRQPTVIRHYNQGYTPLLRLYLTDVLKMALDKTSNEYGPYALEYFSEPMSANRSKLETEKGLHIDLLFSPHWRGHFVDPDKVIAVEFPVLNGMLGLRKLIATEVTWTRLKKNENLLNFKRLVAGLGASWIDVEILAANQIQVVEAQTFDAMFPMLMHGRFDYIPLSVLDAQTTLTTRKIDYPGLSLNSDISLFYPLPFYLYVNAQKAELAERLEKGVQAALADGSIDALFEQHFYYVRPELEAKKRKLVVLRNPLISTERNTFYLQQFLQRYGEGFDILE